MQDLCGTLAEKDEMISRLQSKGNDMVDSVQKEYLNEKNDIIREKQALEEKIARMRYELFLLILCLHWRAVVCMRKDHKQVDLILTVVTLEYCWPFNKTKFKHVNTYSC